MSWRERATPLLVEVADHAAACLKEDYGMPPDVADHAGYTIMRRIAEAVGGASVYLPTVDSIARHERDESIWRDFNGANLGDVARKYGITTIHAYRIIKRMRAADLACRQATLDL